MSSSVHTVKMAKVLNEKKPVAENMQQDLVLVTINFLNKLFTLQSTLFAVLFPDIFLAYGRCSREVCPKNG